MKKLLLTLILCFGSSLTAVGQQPPQRAPVRLSDFENAKPTYCGDRIAVLDGIHQTVPADELIIVIARAGDHDKRASLSKRRLHNVRVYWSEFLYEKSRRNPETIILAEGERVKGLGRLEFYVGGKLDHVMKVAPNADLFVGECYPPDDSFVKNGVYDPCKVTSQRNFYPCRDKLTSRRRRR